jgi:hypothetical protein
LKVPAAVGVPEILIVSVAQEAVTPTGRPVGVPIPVALVVVCVITVSGVLMQRVGVEEAAEAVLASTTVMVPVAFTLPHPPVNGMV